MTDSFYAIICGLAGIPINDCMALIAYFAAACVTVQLVYFLMYIFTLIASFTKRI